MKITEYLAFTVATLLSLQSFGQSPTASEQYTLQERCGKTALERFKSEYKGGVVNTDTGQALVSFTNHYNSKLNKCLVVLTYTDMPKKSERPAPSVSITLFDINENKELGAFWKSDASPLPQECYIQAVKCKSRSEWDALVKPLLEQ